MCRLGHAGQPPNEPIQRHEHPAARSRLAQRPLLPLSPTYRAPARYGRHPHAVAPRKVTDIERRRCSSPAPPRAAGTSTKMSPLFEGSNYCPSSTAVRKAFVRHRAGGGQRLPAMLLRPIRWLGGSNARAALGERDCSARRPAIRGRGSSWLGGWALHIGRRQCKVTRADRLVMRACATRSTPHSGCE